MKNLLKCLGIMLVCTSCSMLDRQHPKEVEIKVAPTSIVDKMEKCISSRINEGVAPLEALKICDSIYRGRQTNEKL